VGQLNESKNRNVETMLLLLLMMMMMI